MKPTPSTLALGLRARHSAAVGAEEVGARRVRAATWVVLCGGLLLAGSLLRVENGVVPILGATPQTCPVHAVLGVPCPGCGLTRGVVSTLHADWSAAWRFHPGSFAIVICCLGVILVQGWVWYRGAETPRNRAWGRVCRFVLIISIFAPWALGAVLAARGWLS